MAEPKYTEPVSQVRIGNNRADPGVGHLVTAREMDSQFVWTAHEPVAVKEGLSQEIIDVVKYRKSVEELPETEAVIIQFGREMFRQKKVASETLHAP